MEYEVINDNDLNDNKLKDNALYDSIQNWKQDVKNKDEYTLGHLDRVSDISVLIGKKMGLTEEELKTLKVGSFLHDIGKIEIPDSILLKDSKLTDEEYSKMKMHTVIGAKLLEKDNMFNNIIPIVKYHHERYDGKGYPENLQGEQIPLLARITSIADAFDAMSSKRAYNTVMDLDTIKQQLKNNRGTQFDPIATDAFLDVLENDLESIKNIQNKK